MDVTWQEFWGMNPHIINCIQKGHEEKERRQDYLQYLWWGTYGISATSVAVEHAVFGRKAQSKYIEDTVYEKMKANRELTEDEKQMELEKFFAQNRQMRANWKRNKQ